MKSVVYAPAALDSFDEILEYTTDTLEVVEILHGRMDLDRHLRRLAGEGVPDVGN